jgi:hypothetical protein
MYLHDWESGNALAIKIKREYNSRSYNNSNISQRIFPMKTNINTIEKINAVVEKFAGRINSNVINTGNQSSQMEDLK